jgi:nickel/cobalt transporter (NicO) family protein
MFSLIAGSLLLSITHALIPNHWFPIAAVSKSENWTKVETAKVTALTGILHTLSTIIIGIVIGFVGYKLGDTIEMISEIYAPVILISIGLYFIIKNLRNKSHTHCHINPEEIKQASKKSKTAIIVALGTMMFFSPCVEIEAFYFTAGQYGWAGIFTLSSIYLLVTVTVMIIIVELSRKSLNALNKKLHFLEHYEKLVTGIILILLGILSFFIHL